MYFVMCVVAEVLVILKEERQETCCRRGLAVEISVIPLVIITC